MTGEDFLKEMRKCGPIIAKETYPEISIVKTCQTGLPKLSSNISPVPEDLNDLIARTKGISVREAFDLNREELVGDWDKLDELNGGIKMYNIKDLPKYNALWDAKVIKTIYNKLK